MRRPTATRLRARPSKYPDAVAMVATVDLDPYYKVKASVVGMRIGAVAAAAELPAQTIRFYERRGLLSPPGRAPNGYREYDASTLIRLLFNRTAQAAGLTLGEIASIVDLRDDGRVLCTHVHSLLLTKLRDVRARQHELADLEAELEGLIERSTRLDPADCVDTLICHILSAAP